MQVRLEPDTWGFERRQARLRRDLCPRTYTPWIWCCSFFSGVNLEQRLTLAAIPSPEVFLRRPFFAALSPTPFLYHATMTAATADNYRGNQQRQRRRRIATAIATATATTPISTTPITSTEWKCLVEENLYIRRSVCKCEDTNPLKDDGTLNDEMAVSCPE